MSDGIICHDEAVLIKLQGGPFELPRGRHDAFRDGLEARSEGGEGLEWE